MDVMARQTYLHVRMGGVYPWTGCVTLMMTAGTGQMNTPAINVVRQHTSTQQI